MSTSPPWQLQHFIEAHVGAGFWDYFTRKVTDTIADVGEPVRITSWYRSPSGNASQGGAGTSQHLIGTAIDLSDPIPGGGMPLALRAKVKRAAALNRWGFFQDEGDHIHLQLWSATPSIQRFVAYTVARGPVSAARIT